MCAAAEVEGARCPNDRLKHLNLNVAAATPGNWGVFGQYGISPINYGQSWQLHQSQGGMLNANSVDGQDFDESLPMHAAYAHAHPQRGSTAGTSTKSELH